MQLHPYAVNSFIHYQLCNDSANTWVFEYMCDIIMKHLNRPARCNFILNLKYSLTSLRPEGDFQRKNDKPKFLDN